MFWKKDNYMHFNNKNHEPFLLCSLKNGTTSKNLHMNCKDTPAQYAQSNLGQWEIHENRLAYVCPWIIIIISQQWTNVIWKYPEIYLSSQLNRPWMGFSVWLCTLMCPLEGISRQMSSSLCWNSSFERNIMTKDIFSWSPFVFWEGKSSHPFISTHIGSSHCLKFLGGTLKSCRSKSTLNTFPSLQIWSHGVWVRC